MRTNFPTQILVSSLYAIITNTIHDWYSFTTATIILRSVSFNRPELTDVYATIYMWEIFPNCANYPRTRSHDVLQKEKLQFFTSRDPNAHILIRIVCVRSITRRNSLVHTVRIWPRAICYTAMRRHPDNRSHVSTSSAYAIRNDTSSKISSCTQHTQAYVRLTT